MGFGSRGWSRAALAPAASGNAGTSAELKNTKNKNKMIPFLATAAWQQEKPDPWGWASGHCQQQSEGHFTAPSDVPLGLLRCGTRFQL